MKAYIKLFCEVIPLIVFFLVNSYDKVILKEIPLEGIFQATFYFIIVSIVVIPIAWYICRSFACQGWNMRWRESQGSIICGR